MRWIKYFLLVGVGVGFLGTTVRADDEKPYVVEERGRSSWRTTFDKHYPTSAEQWKYARETQNKKRLKKADRRMRYLVRRWPNAPEAPAAQQARADMFFSRGKLKDAFKAYQFLIDNYSSRMQDYDAVLECQFEIAVDIMNRKRMRWLFGGYRAPEYAVDYFEDVIRNGPQWSKAPEAQFLIGTAYQKSKELELAITAYAVLGYRYPNCSFAEEAAWNQIQCLDLLRKEYPSSLDILDRLLTSTTVFLTTHPSSKHQTDVIDLRNNLYEVKAKKAFDEAAFYAKVPRKPKAALLYYQRMIDEYPKSALVPDAEKRIAKLEAALAKAEGRTTDKPEKANTKKEPDHV
jgi:outer membrane protein assembly factor BamD (BamD/ComL family)